MHIVRFRLLFPRSQLESPCSTSCKLPVCSFVYFTAYFINFIALIFSSVCNINEHIKLKNYTYLHLLLPLLLKQCFV